jgi:nucleoside-diphosphate-sugar epimerase
MSNKKKNILVTGGSGFFGSHLVKQLVLKGHKVCITTKYNSIFENIRVADVWSKIKVLECDLRNNNSIENINKFNPDIIFHLAAYNDVKGSFENYKEALDSSIIATSNLLEGIKNYSQFIYISTSEIYGKQNEKKLFSENLKPAPISPYSIGKYAGELYAKMHMEQFKKPIKILRPFNIFGEAQSTKAVIPELILKFLQNQDVRITNGSQTREFNYVGNTVNFLLKAMEINSLTCNIINISDGTEISIRDLARTLKILTNSRSKIIIGGLDERKSEIYRMKSSTAKMKRHIKETKIISFKDGLKKTIDWYSNNYVKIFELNK